MKLSGYEALIRMARGETTWLDRNDIYYRLNGLHVERRNTDGSWAESAFDIADFETQEGWHDKKPLEKTTYTATRRSYADGDDWTLLPVGPGFAMFVQDVIDALPEGGQVKFTAEPV